MFSQLARRIVASPKSFALGGSAAALASVVGVAHLSDAPETASLDPNEWRPLRLLHKQQLTDGDRPTYLLRFELAKGHAAIPVSSALLTRMPVGKEKDDGTRAFVLRPYTPVSAPDAPTLDLALKIYPDGKLTPHLMNLKPGDELEFKGPLPKMSVSDAAKSKAIGMVAGGTGITPMLQMANELLRTGYPGTISLVYANVSPGDIMLKDRVEAMAKKHAKFKVHYVVDKAAPGWTGGVGYVNAEMLKSTMPPPQESSLVLVCGPPGMMNSLSGPKVSPREQGPLTGQLKELGYSESMVYKF